MIKENLKMTGSLEIAINGDTVQKIHNLVVDSGKEHVTARLKDNTSDGAMSHMAIGTGTTAASANDTALVSEAVRTAFDSAADTSGTNTIKFVTTFTAVGSGSDVAVTEAGLFNADATGTMLARTVFGAVNKGADDVMTITWTITVS